jgi:uncharacterized protein YhfF
MDIPLAIRPFWQRYQATLQFDASPRFYEAFHFDDNERSANELSELVILGTKRATSSLLWSFDAANKQLPKPGALSVVTNWQGNPLCIIQTNVVTVTPFEEVPEDFAAAEGEGDKSLRYWRHAHWAYFGRECLRIGKEPNRRMPVVCERFAVVYPSRTGAG